MKFEILFFLKIFPMQHAERVAHQVAERLTVQGIRQTRGYKSNLLKKQRQEAAKAAAEAAAKAAAAIATTASPKGRVFEIIF